MATYLPNLFIVGAMKCGTTSLHNYLAIHPDIYMSLTKEINYFVEEKNYKRGLDWYKSHFPVYKKIRGESSQIYTKAHRFQGVPERIHQLVPEAKILYIVRDPIERIKSHYYESQEHGNAPEDINQFLSDYENNHYVLSSMYYMQIAKYLEYFPQDQVSIISLEKLKQNRLHVMNQLFDFLQVPAFQNEQAFDFRSNTVQDKYRATKFRRVVRQLRKAIPQGPAVDYLATLIKDKSWFKKVTERPLRSVTLDPVLEKELRAFLKQDILSLQQLTGEKYEHWLHTASLHE